jgi:hypothetical protein
MFQQPPILGNIGFGVVGELYLEGPLRGQPGVLNTTTAANNVVGRAFTVVDDATASFETSADPQPLEVGAGGTGVFAGILANPKVYSSLGTAADGTLASTLTLPNGTIVELVQETAGLIVTLPEAFAIGDWIWFNQATGLLVRTAPGASAPASSTRVPNGVVVRFESAAAGMAVIAFNG